MKYVFYATNMKHTETLSAKAKLPANASVISVISAVSVLISRLPTSAALAVVTC